MLEWDKNQQEINIIMLKVQCSDVGYTVYCWKENAPTCSFESKKTNILIMFYLHIIVLKGFHAKLSWVTFCFEIKIFVNKQK